MFEFQRRRSKQVRFFMGAQLMFIVTLILKFKLEEKAAGKVEDLMREILITAPSRLIAKLTRPF